MISCAVLYEAGLARFIYDQLDLVFHNRFCLIDVEPVLLVKCQVLFYTENNTVVNRA